MLGIVRSWFDRLFAEEETVVLLLLIVACLLLMLTLGNVLVPIVASIVLAFMMQGIIARLSSMGRVPLAYHHHYLSCFCGRFLWRAGGVITVGLAAAN